jgi:undecaprenyl-diphosphatase
MRSPRLATALLALAALWLAMLLLGAGEVDRAILASLYVAHRQALAQAALWLTEFGGSPVLIPLSVIVALIAWRLRNDWRAPAWFLAMTLTGRLLVELQKALAMRLRPDTLEQLAPITSYAFPSGHSGNSFMVYLGAALLLARGRRRPWALAAATLFAVAIGLTRPMLGVHWPSDVVAGWSFGLFWTLLWAHLIVRQGTADRPGAFSQPRRMAMDKTHPDDSALIDEMEDAPSQSIVSGGNLQREIGVRAEEEHEIGDSGDENDSVTRVHAGDKADDGARPKLPNRD